MIYEIKKVAVSLLAAGVMTACATHPAARMNSAEQYSKMVQAQLDDGDLRAAESTLGEMDLYYPIAAPTQAMQFKLISAYYKAAEMDRTVAAAKRYVRVFPDSADIDQVYYFSGMANYDRGLRGLVINSAERNPLHAKSARESFMALLHCCADSRYAGEASEKVNYLDEALAQYEFGLMRADLLMGYTSAATSRGKSLIDTYPVTNAAGVAEVMLAVLDKPEVLDRLLIATALPLNQDEAEAIAARAGVSVEPVVAAAAQETVVAAIADQGAPATPSVEVAQGPSVPPQESDAAVAPEPAKVAEMAPALPVTPTLADAEPKTPTPLTEPAPQRSLALASAHPSKRYTVQLGSSRQFATVQRHMQRLGLAKAVSYEPRQVNGETWHAATYGVYNDMAEAQRAAADLVSRTGIKDIWVRLQGDVPAAKAEPRPLPAIAESLKARPVETAAKARAAGRYAIQVASEPSIDSLRSELRAMKLEGQVEFHRRVIGDKIFYAALYGAYNTIEAARADLPALQSRTSKSGFWIRAVDENQRVESE